MHRYLMLLMISLFALSLVSCAEETSLDPDVPVSLRTHDAVRTPEPDGECTPDCTDKDCGDDGCGGACGVCAEGGTCDNGVCCVPACDPTWLCGNDGCGGKCDKCPVLESCDQETHTCINLNPCEPDCQNKECGADNCGGYCGTCPCPTCTLGELYCGEDFKCEDIPDSCEDVHICRANCVPGDEACYADCIAISPLDAQIDYNDLKDCLTENGYFDCTPGNEACKESKTKECGDEYFACFGGTLGCRDVYLCLVECTAATDVGTCSDWCFAQGDQEALDTWNLFAGCLQAAGYEDCASYDDECKDAAWKACGADFKACAHGKLSCADMTSCMTECGEDAFCQLTCLVNGSVDAQTAYQAVLGCVEKECGDNPSHGCQQDALNGKCQDSYEACTG